MDDAGHAGGGGDDRATARAADPIAADLIAAIHEHRVLPGMKLSEDEVGDIYGAGRTVVRQALRALAHEGLVTIERNRGAFVAKPSVREAREVFEARALLEPTMARVAAGRCGHTDLARLERHIADEHAALAAGAQGRALMLSGHFHVEIACISGQVTIEAFIRQLVARSALVIALYWRRQTAMCEKHAHHALVDAMRCQDGAAAEELMKGHLVDLLSLLDLREGPVGPVSLRDALAAPPASPAR
ncbi:GntR family transcriptional regulator [Jannaschia donghaensis]|uniref:Putative HTH-type transcriptional regulator YdfH n=1 Tax=Jannaschia donghaensis TaxID=420998 RepID=A0A0M6YP10_9RHOB|nr:GntR family transcriptional regulator [Jannaschia donghaensis]CTQ51273.1 putative HTH-type transcriptional regulator YdfH [Jannaschia donghaensis]